MKTFFLLCLVALFVSGCAPEVQQLRQQLRQLEERVADQEMENARLKSELAEYQELSATLEDEKDAKNIKLMAIKSKTRMFIKEGFDSLNHFSKNRELMDYIGGELIERKKKEGENIAILYMEPLPSDSVISIVQGLFDTGTQVAPLLFREKEGELICIWQGKLIEVLSPGESVLELDTPLHAAAGDRFGFYFPGKAGIPFNSKTGNYSIIYGKVELGERVSGKLSAGNRNYSIGVAGFLE